MIYKIENNQITLVDSRFYLGASGVFCPSVTTYLEAYPKGPEYYAWLKKVGQDADEIRDEAGRRGSNVHKMIENYLNGLEISLLDNDGRLDYSLVEWNMFTRFVDFYTRFEPEIIQSEMNIVDEELREGGTLDLLYKVSGQEFIVDIKTSNAVYPSYWLQVAAYRRMFERISGRQVAGVGILWLNAKTRTDGKKGAIQGNGWQLLVKEDTSKEIELYDCVKRLWLTENDGYTPKQTSYKLSYKL